MTHAQIRFSSPFRCGQCIFYAKYWCAYAHKRIVSKSEIFLKGKPVSRKISKTQIQNWFERRLRFLHEFRQESCIHDVPNSGHVWNQSSETQSNRESTDVEELQSSTSFPKMVYVFVKISFGPTENIATANKLSENILPQTLSTHDDNNSLRK